MKSSLRSNVRFGSKADICSAKGHVHFAPNSDRKNRHAANGHVRFTPESGRVRRKPSCLLRANSGHDANAETCSASAIDDFYAALSTTSLAALSITIGASKYWNSGFEPKIDWIASSNAGPCAFFAASMFFQR
jgi:hypothetical protein